MVYETAAASSAPPSTNWLLLIHQLPAKPAYPRVKIWRRLQALGAVAVKNAVYALPAGERTQEDFEWLLKEIVAEGGEGMICEATLVDGLTNDELRRLFNSAREADYDELAKSSRALAGALGADTDQTVRAEANAKLGRLRRELARIFAIDFFGASGREAAAGLLDAIEARLAEEQAMTTDHPKPVEGAPSLPRGRVWVTRQGVFVDRIASAWFIQRFIDPGAEFKFVAAKGYSPGPNEVRFDMFEAEFTHVGDLCTFEVLLAQSGVSDPALAVIGQIVHDIDMKDAKFGRDETSGIASVIEGIAAATSDDNERLARGAAIFNDLYTAFRKKLGGAA
jgi:hypothetical protein